MAGGAEAYWRATCSPSEEESLSSSWPCHFATMVCNRCQLMDTHELLFRQTRLVSGNLFISENAASFASDGADGKNDVAGEVCAAYGGSRSLEGMGWVAGNGLGC